MSEREKHFGRWQAAVRGKRPATPRIESFLIQALHIIGEEKRGNFTGAASAALKFYKEQLWEQFAEILWRAATQHNGIAFRTIALILEQTGPNDPVRAAIAQMALMACTKNKPVLTAYQFMNIYNKAVKSGFDRTSLRTVKRIYKEFDLDVAGGTRGPKRRASSAT